ncbi:MAG: phosphoribosyltransferase family protein [Actinomycetota bacterium]|nr:phosphoribosyltransferase family protein [Actinomycetota bacterium]MDH5279442.1 phosphoribosyltransferase family protein [Actinomycetota bacterium]
MFFQDRVDAGRSLARKLKHLRGSDLVVLGLWRGGVPVAFEVARSLDAALDVIVVHKLGVPFQPELAMGALGEDGVRLVDREMVAAAHISEEELADAFQHEQLDLDRQAVRVRSRWPATELDGRVALIVDDGIATGASARAACAVARARGAARVVLAAPVAPQGWERRLGASADEYVAVVTPDAFSAVGQFYRDFSPSSVEEVETLLRHGAYRPSHPPTVQQRSPRPPTPEEVDVSVAAVTMRGLLTVPENPAGLVVFAHGSGSSRHSPRNRAVAGALGRLGLATLLVDLLTGEEERHRTNVFDIPLIADRLVEVTRWAAARPELRGLSVGFFGASTGAGAALWAAGRPGAGVAAVVSRGGRPDLAGPHLAHVVAPTLLIVGGADPEVLELNREALARLHCEKRLEVVRGAGHLFEEAGALEQVATLAGEWFLHHLAGRRPDHAVGELAH